LAQACLLKLPHNSFTLVNPETVSAMVSFSRHVAFFLAGLAVSTEARAAARIKDMAHAVSSLENLEKWLKQQGSEALTLPDASGMRLTHWAATVGNVQVLKSLKMQHADPWDGMATVEETPTMHVACRAGNPEIVEYCLSEEVRLGRSRGAINLDTAVNWRDKKNYPCLHYAAVAGHGDVVDMLIKHKADIGAEVGKIGTALHSAAAANQTEATVRLLRNGADPCAKNIRNQIPGDRAVQEEMPEMAAMLLKYEKKGGCERKKGDDDDEDDEPRKKRKGKGGKGGKEGEL